MMTIDPIERQLFLEAVFLKYGYDFRQYAEASLERRFQAILGRFQIADPLDQIVRTLKEPEFFQKVLPHLTVNTTALFRDPSFFVSIRENILPVLRTYPRVNIWIAGCSSGEEAYSLAILLREEGLEFKTTIFATDISSTVLRKARDGIYDLETMKGFAKAYSEAGGRSNPTNYYTASYDYAKFDSSLSDNIVFTEHNLATDSSFIEANFIICRNVVIYFSRELQDRVFELFATSLTEGGFLALGGKETIRFSKCADQFTAVYSERRIYQKTRLGKLI